MDYILLIVFIVISIAFSFLCSILEAVLLSITPSFINIKEAENASFVPYLKKFKEDIDRPLSAILTLNTIAHTVGAIMVGVQAAKIFKDTSLEVLGVNISMEGIIAALMTFAILVLSEIIPKTMGANNWQALTPFTVQSLRFLIFILSPFVWLSQLITKGMKKDKSKSVLSRQDISYMAASANESGTIDNQEFEVINNVLSLDSHLISEVMTPRTVAFTASETMSLADYYKSHPRTAFSRFPVFGKDKDDIKGIVLKDELLSQLIDGKGDMTLGDIKQETLFVNEADNLAVLFEQLVNSNNHFAVVVDEFGAFSGIVTLEDVLETILGLEIVDETDKVTNLRAYAKEKWKSKSRK